MNKTPPVPQVMVHVTVELPQAAQVPVEAVSRRLSKTPPPKTISTQLTKKSSVSKMNADIYPEPTSTNSTPEGKGMTPKPRPGYFH